MIAGEPDDRAGAYCSGCGVDTWPFEMFMVADDVWARAGGGDGFLCIGCVEDRLDRTLEPGDFPAIPINDDQELDSVRLRTRKGSGRRTEPLYPIAVAAVLEMGADVARIAADLGIDESMLRTLVEQQRSLMNEREAADNG